MTSRVDKLAFDDLFFGMYGGNRTMAGMRKLASHTDPKPLSSPQCIPSNSKVVLGSMHLCPASLTPVRPLLGVDGT